MSFKRTFAAAILAATTALPAFAGSEISIEDAYARSSGMMAQAGAAFFTIVNTGDEADTLIDARSDASKVVELHTHIDAGGGVMQMRRDEDGFDVPAHGEHSLMRGADHVMFMGLNAPFEQGKILTVTLVFEKAGEITVEIPVDLERNDAPMPMDGTGMQNGAMNGMGMAPAASE